MTSPRIALIHATPVAVQPVSQAFEANWPEAEVYSLLEDSLSPDLERAGEINEMITGRFLSLGRYVVDCGANAVLFTCSAFGPAIEAVAQELQPIPVLKPNEAMFEDALGIGCQVGMLATFQPSVPPMEDEFHEMARSLRKSATLESVWVPGAMDALLADDADTHNCLVAEMAPKLAHCDAIMLAHFSTARAIDAVRHAVDCPVLTSPGSAVSKLKAVINEQSNLRSHTHIH